jgi:arginyl-tRNA synthetase
LGLEVELPEEGYRGEYLIDLAKECISEHDTLVINQPESFFEQFAKEKLLNAIKSTLANYGINFDVWFSEKTLHTDGSIDATIAILQERGHLFEHEGALWFRSTTFGDDKDRVLCKSTGELTYVAADSAYLKNKVDRGFNQLIMVLGHDHHGYELRLQALLAALGLEHTTKLDIIFYQLVKMKASGELVRMSKRAGNIVTLEGVIETVGTDVARFFYLNRKADAQLEFDIDLALKKTDENPVYYVQYAYVRTRSILAKAAQEEGLHNITELDIAHLGPQEAVLLKKIASLKPLLITISNTYHTHALTYYALELAQTFHAYYGKNRVIDVANLKTSRSRLLVIALLKDTLATVLTLLGITKPESM